MVNEEKEIFGKIIQNLQEHKIDVEQKGTLVYYHGEPIFNTDGYNLLYCIKRLGDGLQEELI